VSPKQRRHEGYPRKGNILVIGRKLFLLSLIWLHPPPPSAGIAGYTCRKERRLTKREVMKAIEGWVGGGVGFVAKKTTQKRGSYPFHSSYSYTYMTVQPDNIFSVLF
jgi:hypothetical protein